MPPKKRQKKVEVEAAPPRTDEQALDDDKHRLMVECCQGVVQVFNNVVKNDWNRPWSVMSPASLSGSGFVISIARRLIVTNAHCVAFSSTFQVRKDGDFDKYEAKILAISHQVGSLTPIALPLQLPLPSH